MVKNQLASGDAGSVPGSRRSPGVGNGNPFQYSCVGESLDERSLAGLQRVGCNGVYMHSYKLHV